ncbi:hypothetical protein MMAGJ_69220 [Mycolicibacterium mageritense]|uniref:Uncharacterized protein n=1 Tax=Mycolicibacterium mageritense TaxID=53462 RepID=A0ABM7I420_MYCME|nr:hypothetical protein MMAGJ_69220 [Mycolicibacterium mageritense]
MFLGSNSTAGPPVRAAAMARGSASTMSVALVTRSQNTEMAPNRSSAFSEPLQPLVSWKLPRPSSGIGACPTSASTGTRLASASPNPGMRLSEPPPDVAATTPNPLPARLYPSAITAAENSCLASTAVRSDRKYAAS